MKYLTAIIPLYYYELWNSLLTASKIVHLDNIMSYTFVRLNHYRMHINNTELKQKLILDILVFMSLKCSAWRPLGFLK